MDTRVAVISIIVEQDDAIEELNTLLHEARQYIIGRMGIPYRAKEKRPLHGTSSMKTGWSA